MQNFEIKPATPADADVLYSMILEMAAHEHAEDQVRTTPDIVRATICNNKNVFALIGYYNGKPVAYVMYFYIYSSYLGKQGMYIEDIFIKPIYQRLGLGKTIMQHMAKLAVEKNCDRLDWTCLRENTNAVNFYKHLGTDLLENRLYFRLEAPKLIQFVEGQEKSSKEQE